MDFFAMNTVPSKGLGAINEPCQLGAYKCPESNAGLGLWATRNEMVKIKFDIGGGEVVNCYAKIKAYGTRYAIHFDDGSFDNWCKFDRIRRCFFGA